MDLSRAMLSASARGAGGLPDLCKSMVARSGSDNAWMENNGAREKPRKQAHGPWKA